jgi:hypothetical protein
VKRVGAWRASGQSAREFCSGRDFSPKNLVWWSWHLSRTGSSLPAKPELSQTKRPEIALARVVRRPVRARTEEAAIVVQKPVRVRGPEPTIVVHVGPARIEVGASDRAALTTVVDAILASSAAGERT